MTDEGQQLGQQLYEFPPRRNHLLEFRADPAAGEEIEDRVGIATGNHLGQLEGVGVGLGGGGGGHDGFVQSVSAQERVQRSHASE